MHHIIIIHNSVGHYQKIARRSLTGPCLIVKIQKMKLTKFKHFTSKELITLASSELTKSKEIITEWQSAASNLLVVLGINYSQEVSGK